MTKMLKTTAIALTLAATALTGAPAYAKGGGADVAQQREKLRAELQAARAANQADCQSASLWEMMFGHDDETATAKAAPSVSVN